MNNAIQLYSTMVESVLTIGLYFTGIICFISLAVNVSKIKNVQCTPFQNKKPDYPDKVIELLQAIVSSLQHETEEIQKLKNEIETLRNGGVKTGMKSKETVHNEEMIQLQKEQVELLRKLLDYTSGEEKKKMLEKLKQATDIMNEFQNGQQ